MNSRQRQALYAAEARWTQHRLVSAFANTPPETRVDGWHWYRDAEAIVALLADRYHQPRPQVAGILAVLSPRQRWRKNVESAIHVLEGEPWRVAGYAANREKAERIADGEPALFVLSGDKVSSFWANLIGSRYAVTIDTWAQRAAIGRMAEQPKGPRYARLAQAYAAAAHMVGWTPREFQAAIWLATRPRSEHAKDKIAMEEI
jgi:hypothetical protein